MFQQASVRWLQQKTAWHSCQQTEMQPCRGRRRPSAGRRSCCQKSPGPAVADMRDRERKLTGWGTHSAWAAVSCDSASANHSTRASTRSSLLRRGADIIQACRPSDIVLWEARPVPETAQSGAWPLPAAAVVTVNEMLTSSGSIAPVLHPGTQYAQRGNPSACSQARAAPPAMRAQQTTNDALSNQ